MTHMQIMQIMIKAFLCPSKILSCPRCRHDQMEGGALKGRQSEGRRAQAAWPSILILGDVAQMAVVELGIDFEPSSQRCQEMRVEVAPEEEEGIVLAQSGFIREAGGTPLGVASGSSSYP
jgi:hypothetical protein